MGTVTYAATDVVTGKVLATGIPLVVESFSQSLNGGGTLTGSLNLQAVPDISPEGQPSVSNAAFIDALEPRRSHLWALYNNYPVWDGIVWDWPDQSRTEGQLPISASTIDSILGKRFITTSLNYPAGTDLFTQVNDLVRYALTKTSPFIVPGSPNAGPFNSLVAQQLAVAGLVVPNKTAHVAWPSSYQWSDEQSVADALTALVQSANMEFYFRPGRDASGNLTTTLVLGYTTVGRPYPQARYSVTYPGSAADYGFPRTGSQSSNFVWANATPNGGTTQWNSQPPHGVDLADLTAGYPVLEAIESQQNSVIENQSQVDAFADGQVTLLTQAMTNPVIKIPDGAIPGVLDVALGDTFPFAATSELHPAGAGGTPGYQELVRLTEWEFFPPSKDEAAAYLQLQTSAITAVI